MEKLTLDQAVEWRAPIWSPAVSSCLTRGSKFLKKGVKVLELGYNSGLMSCYLKESFDWSIVGYELLDDQKKMAEETAKRRNLSGEIDFRVCPPEETFNIEGTFDGIFLKSVLYHNKDREKYREWIKWLYSKLNDGGVLMAIENCHGHAMDRFYREKIKKVSWKDNILFDSDLEKNFKEIFKEVDVEYFGGVSQYLTAFPQICYATQKIEKMIGFNNADKCFIASIVAIK